MYIQPNMINPVSNQCQNILDFSSTIYGEVIEVDFLERLRAVEPFESVDALKQQLATDIERARQIGAPFVDDAAS